MKSSLGTMCRTAGLGAVLALSSLASQALSLGYHGTFGQDDQLFETTFTLTSGGLFSANTLSFAGGVSTTGQVVAAGGFAPVLSLYATASGELVQSLYANGSNPDPATGFAWDASISTTLTAGQYTLVLSQDGNYANGPFFADGFAMTGTPDYTGQMFGQPGSHFLLVTDGSQRTGQWAFDIAADGLAAPVPEPDSLALMLAGLASLGLVSRSRRPA